MNSSISLLDVSRQPDYYMNVREFPGGVVEACMRVVRPMSQDMMLAENVTSPADLPLSYRTKSAEEAASDREANHKRSVRRARQAIRWLCMEMMADRLLTLTFRGVIDDREYVAEVFKRFVRLYRKFEPDWRYVSVLELQERGSYHLHCAVKGFQRISVVRKCWYIACGGTGQEEGTDTPGSVNITSPVGRWGKGGREWKTGKLAGYLTKYLHKTFDETSSEKKRYWHSRGLSVPVPERHWIFATNMTEALMKFQPLMELAHGLSPDYTKSWLSEDGTTFWMRGRAI